MSRHNREQGSWSHRKRVEAFGFGTVQHGPVRILSRDEIAREYGEGVAGGNIIERVRAERGLQTLKDERCSIPQRIVKQYTQREYDSLYRNRPTGDWDSGWYTIVEEKSPVES